MDWIEDLKRTHVNLSPLWLRALDLGICPKCYSREALYKDINANDYRYKSCVACGSVFVFDQDFSGETTPF